MEEQAQSVADFYDRYKPYFFELRKQLFFIFIMFAVGCGLGFFYNQKIFNFILHLYNFKGVTVITTSPYQYIDLTLTITFLAGVLVAMPYSFIRLYYFFKPALKPSEISLITRFAPLSIGLFIVGFSFGMWIMQLIINFYSVVWTGAQVNSFWDIQHFFSQIIFTSILTGFIFQIPIAVTFFIRLNIIKKHALAAKRRYIYVLLLVIAVLLPPTDLISLIMLVLPLFFLFEFGLLLNRNR